MASVQNTVGRYDDAREWLTKALRAMEKLTPLPVRSLAFTQVQQDLICLLIYLFIYLQHLLLLKKYFPSFFPSLFLSFLLSYSPRPNPSFFFTKPMKSWQVQLSTVLIKQRHLDEAVTVISSALTYHAEAARAGYVRAYVRLVDDSASPVIALY